MCVDFVLLYYLETSKTDYLTHIDPGKKLLGFRQGVQIILLQAQISTSNGRRLRSMAIAIGTYLDN